ncbi:hypothetical protein E2C01_004052 [Portunus trituberculatus]|uniref:Uncharacterized protein n=1 Tax=Portunus trituberculatus TaxID=210409 RepID=A0A5B7CPL7_PORTR|nr:hypothetical protein [Portunus trituberculatus]
MTALNGRSFSLSITLVTLPQRKLHAQTGTFHRRARQGVRKRDSLHFMDYAIDKYNSTQENNRQPKNALALAASPQRPSAVGRGTPATCLVRFPPLLGYDRKRDTRAGATCHSGHMFTGGRGDCHASVDLHA